MLEIKKENKTLALSDIINYYKKAIKPKSDFKYGLEYERLSLNGNDFSVANIQNVMQIAELFAKDFSFEVEKENGVFIQATNKIENSSISLEPGGQFEFSLAPKKNISEIESLIKKYTHHVDKIAKNYGIKFVPLGLSPVSVYQNIKILNKTRYILMDKYFKKFGGRFYPVMMRETAGFQVNVDFESEEMALFKLRFLSSISPLMLGITANSNRRFNKITNYKSFRGLSWQYMDNDRCNLFYKNLLKDRMSIGFEEYINYILKVPMIFIIRNNEYIEINGKINFETFMKNGYLNYFPTLDDYILHSSLTFPDVRLKNCLEIRNHDSVNIDLVLAIIAFYKGILDENTIFYASKIVNFKYEEIKEYLYKSAKYGLNYDIKNKSAYSILKSLVDISSENLADDEKRYLNPLINLINEKKMPLHFNCF